MPERQLVNEMWLVFRKTVVQPGVDPAALGIAKIAYFAGVLDGLRTETSLPTIMTGENANEVKRRMRIEVMEFLEGVVRELKAEVLN